MLWILLKNLLCSLQTFGKLVHSMILSETVSGKPDLSCTACPHTCARHSGRVPALSSSMAEALFLTRDNNCTLMYDGDRTLNKSSSLRLCNVFIWRRYCWAGRHGVGVTAVVRLITVTSQPRALEELQGCNAKAKTTPLMSPRLKVFPLRESQCVAASTFIPISVFLLRLVAVAAIALTRGTFEITVEVR